MNPNIQLYHHKPKSYRDMIIHLDSIFKKSFSGFVNGNPLIVRYMRRHVRIILSSFILLDTDLIVDYIRSEDPGFLYSFSEHAGEILELLNCFKDHGEKYNRQKYLDELKKNEMVDFIDETNEKLLFSGLENNCKEFNNLLWVVSFIVNRFPMLFNELIQEGAFDALIANAGNSGVVEIVYKLPPSLTKEYVDKIMEIDAENEKNYKEMRESELESGCSDEEKKEIEKLKEENIGEDEKTGVEEDKKYLYLKAASVVPEYLIITKDNLIDRSGCCRIIEHVLSDPHSDFSSLIEHINTMIERFEAEDDFILSAMRFRIINFLVKTGKKPRNGFKNIRLDFASFPKRVMAMQIKLLTSEQLDNKLIDFFLVFSFENPECACIFNLFFPFLKKENTPDWFYAKRDDFIRKCWAEIEGPMPLIPALFYFILEFTDKLDPMLKEFVERYNKINKLNFEHRGEIEDWLEDCDSNMFKSYLISIILEALPEHEFFKLDIL